MATSDMKSTTNLWDLLTPEEVGRIRAAAKGVATAEEDVRRISQKLEEVETTLTALSSRRFSNAMNAAARALAEAPPLPEQKAPPIDRSELEEQAVGLRERLKGSEDVLARVRGALRTLVVEIVRQVCMDRLAPEYLKAADRIGEVFAMLLGAEEFMENLSPGDPSKVRHVADRIMWSKLYLPGSFEVPELKKRSHEEWGLPVLLSGSQALEAGIGPAALTRLKDSVRAEIGFWPFK